MRKNYDIDDGPAESSSLPKIYPKIDHSGEEEQDDMSGK